MAKVTILCWQDIPSVVEAKEAGASHKIQLSARFQELIDLVAMRKKLAGTDEYLMHWSKGRPEQRDGGAEEVARAVAGEIEARYDTIRAQELEKCRS